MGNVADPADRLRAGICDGQQHSLDQAEGARMNWLGYDAPIETRLDFRQFLAALGNDLEARPDVWINTSLDGFLRAMSRYAGEPLEAFIKYPTERSA